VPPFVVQTPGEPDSPGRRKLDLTAAVRADPETESFLDRLQRERGYSPRTILSYRIDLAQLQALVLERSAAAPGNRQDLGDAPLNAAPVDWLCIDERAVRAWVARSSREGLAARSIARRLSAWRGFYDWLAEQRGIPANPVRGVRAPRVPRHLPSALAPDQAVKLVDDPQAQGFEALRDRAMFELLYSSGLRLSELLGLDVCFFEADSGMPRSSSWLDFEQAEVTVTGKGAKRRTVPVGRAALEALTDWMRERERFLTLRASSDKRPLFLSSRGTRLSARSVQLRLKRRGIVQGVPAKVHPHMLRHSFASHLLQSSGDLRAVQELLGHASIASTQIYTALDFQRLAAVYDAAHPRARRAEAEATAPAKSTARGRN
jgi:integrase/recombinase XerC